jgi:hypothetical protein
MYSYKSQKTMNANMATKEIAERKKKITRGDFQKLASMNKICNNQTNHFLF